MKNNRRIKITAFMLVLCMIISILPGNVIALTDDSAESAETEQAVTPTTEEKSLADEILEPIIVSEDITKRGEKEKHFLCDDGSYIAVSYPQAVHEQVDGEWVDIEYDVTADGNGISPVDDTIKVKFANNTNSAKLVKLESGDYKISWTVEAENENGDITEKVKLSKDSKATIKTTKEITQENKEKIKNEAKYTKEEVKSLKKQTKEKIKNLELAKTANIEQHKDVVSANVVIEDHNREQIQSISFAQSNVEYVGVFGEGTTLRYVMSQGKINEEIVLESYNGFKSYSMVIDTDGLIPVKTENGRVNLTDENGVAVVTIAAPYMYDAVEEDSYDIDVTVTQESKKEWRITYTPDFEWLTDKDRVYPVVIDPVVTTHDLDDYQVDTYVYEGQSSAVYSGEEYLWVGYQISSSNQKTEYISYWGQNWDMPFIDGDSSNITDVSFYIRAKDDTSSIGRISLYNTGVFSGDISTFTWNNRPSLYSHFGYVTSMLSNNWLCFSPNSLYEMIKECYDYSIHEYMFALKNTGTSGLSTPTKLYSSDSSYIPYIAIEYVPGETTDPGTGGGGGTTSPETNYPAGHTMEIETGTYIIENMFNGRYLHHSEGNNTVNVWNFGNQPYQRWNVVKNTSDGTYSFSSNSTNNPGLSMEVYYAEDANTQPITMYNYSNATNSRAYKFYIIKNANGTYSIMPTVSTNKVLEVYTGSNDSAIYGDANREFQKKYGESVQLKTQAGTLNQCWTFKSTSVYDNEWDNSLADGVYSIVNVGTNNALTHNVNTNVAEAYPYSQQASQRWTLTKVDDSGIYVLSPASQPLFSLELYYASINGACNDGHTFTLNNYTNNQGSPYIRVKLKKVGNNYCIYPLSTPNKCIDVYTGANTTYTFNTRTFTKNSGQFLQNMSYDENADTQRWTFTQLVGLYPQSKNLYIGDTYDLDDIIAYHSSSPLTWSIVSGSEYVDFDSTTNQVLAKSSGTAVFETTISGVIYQFTVTAVKAKLLEDGIYYIRNEFSQKYMDIENPENGKSNIIANQCVVQQNTKDTTSKSQVWKITYDGETGFYGLSPIINLGTLLGKNKVGNRYVLQTISGIYPPQVDSQKWAIVPSGQSGTYNLVLKDSLDKAMCIELNNLSDGTDIVLQDRDDSSIAQNWIFEDATSGVKGVAQTLTIGETLTGTLNNEKDFEMYKVTLSGETKYSLTVNPPVIEENFFGEDNLSNYAKYTVVVYVNENQGFGSFEGLYMTNYQTQSFYLKCSGSGTKDYYIIIMVDDTTDFVPGNFDITIETTASITSSELDGWRYKGEKHYSGTSATLYYDMGEGMDEERQYTDGTFSYAELFEDAMEIWSERLDDEGIPLSFKKRTWLNSNYFTVSTSNQIPDYIGGYNDAGNVVLNISDIDSSASSNHIVETFCHELGHSLGLADLYINSNYGYEYNGELVDNSDHLMYGTGGRNLGSNIIHNDEITGVNIIRAPGLNYSFKEYTEEDLYNESEYIVKGTVVDTEKYSDDYTRVYFAIDECLYANVNDVPNIISFLQYTPEGKYSDVDPLYKVGEKYLLYLSYGLFNELFVVGGPQGRFLIEETDGEIEVTNQIDRVVEKEGKKQLGIEKKFSKKLKEFNKQAKEKIEKTKKNK